MVSKEEKLLNSYKRHLAEWVVFRWDSEVKNRPLQNIHRRTLDNTWRQMYRKVTDGKELPRESHDVSLDLFKRNSEGKVDD